MVSRARRLSANRARQDETIVTFRHPAGLGEARRLPTEEQLSARTGARWKTFAGKVRPRKMRTFDWRFRPIDYAENNGHNWSYHNSAENGVKR